GAALKLTVAGDPEIIKAQVASAKQREDAQRKYSQLLVAEQDSQRGPLEFRQKALEGVQDQMHRQSMLQQQIAAYDDPTVLRERLKLAQQIMESTKQREKAEHDDPARTADVLSYKKQIADIEHQAKLESLTKQLSPSNVKQQPTQKGPQSNLIEMEQQVVEVKQLNSPNIKQQAAEKDAQPDLTELEEQVVREGQLADVRDRLSHQSKMESLSKQLD